MTPTQPSADDARGTPRTDAVREAAASDFPQAIDFTGEKYTSKLIELLEAECEAMENELSALSALAAAQEGKAS